MEKLATALVSRVPNRVLSEIRFYTGVPDPSQDPFWHGFWSNKLRYLGSRGIHVYRGGVNPGGQETRLGVFPGPNGSPSTNAFTTPVTTPPTIALSSCLLAHPPLATPSRLANLLVPIELPSRLHGLAQEG